MRDDGWNANGLSPFLSERARRRAPQVLSYAAITGAAILVSPSGEIVLFSGAAAEIDVERVARLAARLGGRDDVVSFAEAGACVHAAPVCMGWMLCIVSTVGASAGQIVERLRRACAVLALALVDGPSPRSSGGERGGGGAPSEAFVTISQRKN